MTDALILAYAAVAILVFGFFISTQPPRLMWLSFLMAAVWPAALLLIAGFLIGERWK